MFETKRDKIDRKLREIAELVNDLKSRIIPQDKETVGTESFELQQCVEAIEFLLQEKEIWENLK